MKVYKTLISGDCPDGWVKLVDPLVERCKAEGAEIHQIKEKFGGLRFYASGASVELNQDIRDAERRSFEICLNCGDPGKLRGGANTGWIRTLCDKCEAHYQKHRDLPGRS